MSDRVEAVVVEIEIEQKRWDDALVVEKTKIEQKRKQHNKKKNVL